MIGGSALSLSPSMVGGGIMGGANSFSPSPSMVGGGVAGGANAFSSSPMLGLPQDSFAGANPFSGGGSMASAAAVPNPFQSVQSPKPSINELRGATGSVAPPPAGTWGTPLDAVSHNDPFML